MGWGRGHEDMGTWGGDMGTWGGDMRTWDGDMRTWGEDMTTWDGGHEVGKWGHGVGTWGGDMRTWGHGVRTWKVPSHTVLPPCNLPPIEIWAYPSPYHGEHNTVVAKEPCHQEQQ